ncbi:hypothetical protein LPU83_pLPU83b_0050 (plasmid) [Rhizobium favelukesii]|uniref:Uncharacterized protein n=1 Tax=Rhizobium favelukesii TaxID=348824 RepID=W6RI54_9HYPH|nr:hypothetical protein LPU83_pLPU83b_0050 [Rhizobium favelukesii]
MIAAPTLIYAGRFFYQSAWNALKHGRTNMDVPISLAVTLSYSMSLWETIHHGEHAWFDASVSLLFFLLIGRTLDHVMRDKARAAITGWGIGAPKPFPFPLGPWQRNGYVRSASNLANSPSYAASIQKG